MTVGLPFLSSGEPDQGYVGRQERFVPIRSVASTDVSR
jgi:hypothetical protein